MSSTPGTRGSAASTRPGSALEIQPQLSARQRLVLFEARTRRAARARRRLIVTVLLFLSSAAAWTCVVLDLVHWGAAVAPSALLLLVLIAGRRAAIAARRAEAAWAAARHRARQRATQARALANGGPYVPRNRMRVTGVAVHGSEAATQAIPLVEKRDILDEILDEPREEPVTVLEVDAKGVVAPAEEALGGGLAWNPVPVPLPTYVTKPAAPRREPTPLASRGESSRAGAEPAAEAPSVAEVLQPDIAEQRAEDELIRGDVPRTRTETLAQPLEEILARRRAAG
ncbi:hypothetical protein [Antribacter gilvus]|uniref:hypothetical protein n=1 Tax=Antribacter gilvus TaxID=2304675 RepID=UPI000F7A1B4A|nr:hypothetical protein [Antribacter gilvus]